MTARVPTAAAALVYDALPAAKRPPWLKPDKIEAGARKSATHG